MTVMTVVKVSIDSSHDGNPDLPSDEGIGTRRRTVTTEVLYFISGIMGLGN